MGTIVSFKLKLNVMGFSSFNCANCSNTLQFTLVTLSLYWTVNISRLTFHRVSTRTGLSPTRRSCCVTCASLLPRFGRCGSRGATKCPCPGGSSPSRSEVSSPPPSPPRPRGREGPRGRREGTRCWHRRGPSRTWATRGAGR